MISAAFGVALCACTQPGHDPVDGGYAKSRDAFVPPGLVDSGESHADAGLMPDASSAIDANISVDGDIAHDANLIVNDAGTDSSLPPELRGVDLSDPEPVAVDLTGEVRAPGPRVLATNLWHGNFPETLTLIELATGTTHAAGFQDYPTGSGMNGGALVANEPTTTGLDSISILRLTKDGYLPPRHVAGYANVAGVLTYAGGNADQRFSLYARHTNADRSIDVIDLVEGRRHGFIEDPLNGGKVGMMAPKGYYFATHFFTRGQPNVDRYGWSKITSQGVSPLVHLPDDTITGAFSGDGRYYFYTQGTPDVTGSLHVIELPLRARDLAVPLADASTAGGVVTAASDTVYVEVMPATSNKKVWYRIAPSGASTLVSDPARRARYLLAGGRDALVMYEDGSSRRLELRLGSAGTPYVLADYENTDDDDFLPGFIGTGYHYTKGGELHVVTVDAQGAHDMLVQEPGEVLKCMDARGDTLLLQDANDGGVILVNLAQPSPKRIAKVLPAAGATRTKTGCPRLHRTRQRVIYGEQTATKQQLWTVDFTSNDVTEPAMVFEADIDPDYGLEPTYFDD